MKGTVRLAKIYKDYHEDVNFFNIYIREAHAKDGWWFGKGLPRFLFNLIKIDVATHLDDPKTIEERRAAAGECDEALKYGVRTLVDEMDDAVNEAYAGWPTRLYLIGLDGKVVYHGGVGPYDFHPYKLEAAIKDYFGK
jgi:hypothetical protein